MAQQQIQKQPSLRKRTRTYKQNSSVVLHKDGSAVMTIWGRDSDTQDGLSPSFAVVDEAHAYPDNSMMEVIESGQGARSQPLTYIITTAGFDLNAAIYREEHDLAERMLEGSIEKVPENFFALIYTLDDDDEWPNEDVWVKANPNLGISCEWRYMRDRIAEALQIPSKQNEILTKNLNIWTQADTRWITDEDWMSAAAQMDESELDGRMCFIGIDLSSHVDVTAIAVCFPMEGGKYRFIYRFFIPEEGLIERERRDKMPYTDWVRRGLLLTTPGKTVQHDFVEQEILNLAAKFDVVDGGYDPWQATRMAQDLERQGLLLAEYRQTYGPMAEPTKQFERLLLDGRIVHDGDPIMRWMVSCTEVKSDRQGNIMPMKPKRDSTGKRIDGVPASIMALDRAIRHEIGGSEVEVYAG